MAVPGSERVRDKVYGYTTKFFHYFYKGELLLLVPVCSYGQNSTFKMESILKRSKSFFINLASFEKGGKIENGRVATPCLLLMERLCSKRCKFFPLRVDHIKKGGKTKNGRVASPEMYPFTLTPIALRTAKTPASFGRSKCNRVK